MAATDPTAGQGLSDEQIRSELVIFMLAGHDTTATTLAYALWALGRDLDMQRRVAAEAEAIGNRELTPDDVFAHEIEAAEIVYIEGYLWDEAAAKDASRKAMKLAHQAGGKIALTLSDSFCVGRFRDEFLHLFHNELDILFANEDEAHALFEVENFEQVVEKAKAWGGIAALTRSAKGCVVVHGSQVHEIPAAPVSKLVDTTGAGDQFAAGFLYGLTHGKSLHDCGKLGGLAAAEVIAHYGARPEVSLKELAEKNGLS